MGTTVCMVVFVNTSFTTPSSPFVFKMIPSQICFFVLLLMISYKYTDAALPVVCSVGQGQCHNGCTPGQMGNFLSCAGPNKYFACFGFGGGQLSCNDGWIFDDTRGRCVSCTGETRPMLPTSVLILDNNSGNRGSQFTVGRVDNGNGRQQIQVIPRPSYSNNGRKQKRPRKNRRKLNLRRLQDLRRQQA